MSIEFRAQAEPEPILPEIAEADDNARPALEYSLPPIEHLPAPLGEYVATCAEAIGCDPCLIAMPMLAACASAIGDTRAIQIKTGWLEYPVLWAVAVAPSGALKTPALKAAMLGLEEAQRTAFEKYRIEESQHREAIAKWKSQGSTGAEPKIPRPISYYVGDATIQAVCKLLGENPRGLLQKRDELSGWLGGFDQFSKGGNEAAQWLEFHSGSTVKIDRSNEDKPPIYIPHALVSVTGTIQEPILRKLLAGEDGKHFDNGLAARFLMAMPPESERQWREATTPLGLYAKYVELYRNLLALTPLVNPETGRRDPIVFQWSRTAKDRWIEFYNAHAKEMRGFKSDRLKSAWSKLEGQAARIALIFHCVRETYLPSLGDDANLISAGTLETALVWIEWLKNETRRIYYTLTHKGDTRQADKLIAFVRRNSGMTTAAAAARAGAGGRTTEAIEKVMAGLVAAGFATWETPEQPQGGRPTRYFSLKSLPGTA